MAKYDKNNGKKANADEEIASNNPRWSKDNTRMSTANKQGATCSMQILARWLELT